MAHPNRAARDGTARASHDRFVFSRLAFAFVSLGSETLPQILLGSEDLSAFLMEQGVPTAYLHSGIKPMQRLELLRQLRCGEIDVIVGVNLLREVWHTFLAKKNCSIACIRPSIRWVCLSFPLPYYDSDRSKVSSSLWRHVCTKLRLVSRCVEQVLTPAMPPLRAPTPTARNRV